MSNLKWDVTNTFVDTKAALEDDKRYIVSVGGSRCHAKGTLVRMYDGTLKAVEDIVIGDKVLNASGDSYNIVLNTHNGTDELYKVTHRRSGFGEFTCNKDHILALKRRGIKQTGNQRRLGIVPKLTQEEKDQWVFMTVEEYMNSGYNKTRFLFSELDSNIEFDKVDVPVDPYYLGLWLGDGSSNRFTSVTSTDDVLIDYLEGVADSFDLKLTNTSITYSIVNGLKTQNELSKIGYELNVVGNKHIPNLYLYNDRETRLKLLAGLIDSDGYNTRRNTLGISMINESLMLQIRELIKSLGFYSTFGSKISRMKRSDGSVYEVESYIIEFNNYDFDELNKYIKLDRKRISKSRDRNKSIFHSKLDITPVGQGEYFGFELSGDKLFKLDNGIIQHNSGKTYGLLQLMFIYAVSNPNSIIVIARKHYTTLRKTIIKQDLPPFLEAFKYRCKFNKTDSIVIFNNGSIIQFIGLDNESALRGLQSDIAWINEATEVTFDSFNQIDMRATKKLIVDYNPSRLDFFIDKLPDNRKTVIHSTYLNNPFLTEEQITTIKQLKQFDEGLYNIFCLGIPATSREHVYNAFKQEERPSYFNEADFIYGMDIGYNTTCLLRIYYHGDEIWMEEVLYEKHMAISDFILKMKEVGIEKNKLIIADAAARLSIEEIRKNGYSVRSSDKGVSQGILITKSFKLSCSEDSKNLIRECFEYTFKRLNGELTDVPIKSETIHLMDAMQYGIVYIHKYLRGGSGRRSLLF